ncbi:MAG TPA: outer membrane beta-barrel protein [Reyranella sp.]|nr:outer membrane beta-barrel protein [Reyranella sp.]
MVIRGIPAAALLAFAAIGVAPAHAQLVLPSYSSGPSWTGFYAGAGFGSGAALQRAIANPGGGTLNIDGLAGGGVLASVHAGVDYQVMPQAVIGLLAEGTWSSMSATMSASVPGASASITSRADLGLAILARGGVLATPSILVYLTGGYAGQNFHTTGAATAGGAAANFTRDDYFNGWTVGGGLEKMLRGGWSTKFEYRYSQFESKYFSTANLTVQPFTHTARVGLSYRFGAGKESTESAAPNGWRGWTGVYGGVAGGAGIMTNKLSANTGGASANIDSGGQGLLGSVLLGADYQAAEQFVVGLVGDLTWPGMQSMLTAGGGGASATVATRTNMGWSLLARAGWLPMPSTLVYLQGGYTSQSFTTTGYAGNGSTLFQSEDRLGGFAVGPGLELMIAGGWSTRLEYRYSQFETRTLASGVTMQPSTHAVRAGLAYKFGVN